MGWAGLRNFESRWSGLERMAGMDWYYPGYSSHILVILIQIKAGKTVSMGPLTLGGVDGNGWGTVGDIF
jgi:hypothetical protein